MPALAYGKSAYRRDNGDLPEQRLLNLFLEASPTDDEGVVLLSRAGLVEDSAPGTAGPVRGMFSNPGMFSGAKFSVVGGNLYNGTTLVGAIPGSGPVSFATDGIDELLINAGAAIRRTTNGTSLSTVTFPDTANVRRIGFISGLFIAIRDDSDQFYWSAVNDGSSWNALDYATAESSADNLLDLITLGDTIWLFGQDTTEPWAITGSPDLPFRKIEQSSYPKGIIDTGCAAEIEGRLYWVGNDARVYTDGLVPIADEGLAERIRASDEVSCFAFAYEGHPFFNIRLDAGVWAYDATTKSISEFGSYLRPTWRVACAMTDGTEVYLGDDELNKIWTFGGSSENGDVIEHRFTAIAPVSGGAVVVDNIGMDANVGRAEVLEGVGSDPQVEMRYSRDEEKSWSEWRPKSLGRQGEYRKRVRWNRCGMFDSPAAMFEFRHTDTAPFRVSGLTMNEPGGGRGR